jgi:hypothetical protein
VFTARAVAAVNAYGILLLTPLLVSFLVVSLIRIGVHTLLIPCLVAAATAYFLPFGFGNTHITRLVRAFRPAAGNEADGVVVQLALSPRIRSGLRAVLEDADDIGLLGFTSDGLRFEGDSVNLSVPFDRIEQVRLHNIGLRGLYICGQRIQLMVSGLAGVDSIEFAERASWRLPVSRSIIRKLHERLSAGVPQRSQQAAPA